jgi:20S proteasome alpha/beta subunit
MSCIVALEGCDGFVLASDGRRVCQDGRITSHDTRKVFGVGQYCGIGFTGDERLADDAWKLMRKESQSRGITESQNYVNHDKLDVIRRMATKVLQDNKKSVELGLTMLIAGYEGSSEDGTKPAIYKLSYQKDAFKPERQERGWAVIGSSDDLSIALPGLYGRGGAVEHLKQLAVYAILTAMHGNAYVGGEISVSVILRPGPGGQGGYRMLDSIEVAAITQHNKASAAEQAERRALQDVFWHRRNS